MALVRWYSVYGVGFANPTSGVASRTPAGAADFFCTPAPWSTESATENLATCVNSSTQAHQYQTIYSALIDDTTTPGYVVSLGGGVTVTSSDGASTASANTGVSSGSTITTSANSSAVIRLNDGSILRIGQNTTVRLDQFSFDQNDPNSTSVSWTLTQGDVNIEPPTHRLSTGSYFVYTPQGRITATPYGTVTVPYRR